MLQAARTAAECEERLPSLAAAESLGHVAGLSLRNGCSSACAALQPGRRGSMNALPLRDHRGYS